MRTDVNIDLQSSIVVASGQQTAGSPVVVADTLISIENATGSNYSDTIKGTTGQNILRGLEGNDVFIASADSAGTGLAGDTYDGGLGRDTLDLSAFSFGVNLTSQFIFSITPEGDTGEVSDRFTSVENFILTDYADLISVGGTSGTFDGGGGFDAVVFQPGIIFNDREGSYYDVRGDGQIFAISF